MTKIRWLAGIVAAAVLAAVGAFTLAGHDPGYTLKLVMANATNLVSGSRVEIGGEPVGQVTALATSGDQALVTVSVDDAHAPMHAGTTAQIQWRGILGERVIELLPGQASNPQIPSGGLIQSGNEQVELDQVLSALDPATRAHLNATVGQMEQSLAPHTADVQATLAAAGPSVQELGSVLDAIGQDGPAIRNLITDLTQLTAPLAARQGQLQQVIGDLASATNAIATQQNQLQSSLGQLPGTLTAAKQALDGVPSAVDATVPLLNDLKPATDQLASVAASLSPLLTALQPTVAELGPVLDSANVLLRNTPSLLDSTHAALPGITQAADQLNPAVTFLRPYTPDIMGWLANWSAAFANYDAQGHYFHGLVMVGTNVLDDNPGVVAGLKGGPNSTPAPGLASGQAWVDANGSGPR